MENNQLLKTCDQTVSYRVESYSYYSTCEYGLGWFWCLVYPRVFVQIQKPPQENCVVALGQEPSEPILVGDFEHDSENQLLTLGSNMLKHLTTGMFKMEHVPGNWLQHACSEKIQVYKYTNTNLSTYKIAFLTSVYM